MAASPKPPRYFGISHHLRRLDLAQIPHPLFGPPPGAEGVVVRCDCGAEYRPPWARRLPDELSIHASSDGKLWAPAQVRFQCPICASTNLLDIPVLTDINGYLAFFGDESEQPIGKGGLIFVYVFVAIHPGFLPLVNERLLRAKYVIRPHVDPHSWVLHLKDVRNPNWREKNGSRLSTREVDSVITNICEMIGANESGRIVSATVLPPSKVSHSSAEIYELALTVSLFATTELATSRKFAPSFFLESTTLDHEKNLIDYTVEKIGRGLRHSLGYVWLSRGIVPSLPISLPKGSRSELEIADLLAFVIRRHMYRAYEGNRIEFPVKLLGDVNWNVISSDRFTSTMCRDFPWAEGEER